MSGRNDLFEQLFPPGFGQFLGIIEANRYPIVIQDNRGRDHGTSPGAATGFVYAAEPTVKGFRVLALNGKVLDVTCTHVALTCHSSTSAAMQSGVAAVAEVL